MFQEPMAHVSPEGRTHGLREHLLATADLAGEFAAAFGFRQWGRLAGLWHDLGKYAPAFQKKLEAAASEDAHLEARGRVDHSTAGALQAVAQFQRAGRLLAYIAAGHHAGLPDWTAGRTGRSALAPRLADTQLLENAKAGGIPEDLLDQPFPAEKPRGLDCAFWVRMLFSCVVDADFLDTEAFFDPERSRLRGFYPTLSDLKGPFDAYMARKQAAASDTPVNRIRRNILERCIAEAGAPPGCFSLTVPTGGGKTLSSMGFALHHAAAHAHRRVIYVIPYTSIVEQTADQFRAVFGDVVVEHHSNLDPREAENDNNRSRLACENWDAPLIVTTSVQFFESLFAARPGRCRKLHNLARSVVILDEAQLLPTEFLRPILKALDELRAHYGVTLLLSTATQPALGPHESPGFVFKGVDGIREIVPDPAALYRNLKRVRVKRPDDPGQVVEWEELAGRAMEHLSVLCIVNRRDDARLLWSLMPRGTIHLSALMCGAHRSRRIAEIKVRLAAGQPTRVISTQLVEAGVDLDFPVVYRAMAGLDSIAQAAGRCNREGLLQSGTVEVFNPPTHPPAGVLRQAADIGARLLAQATDDPLAPERFTAFFRELYWIQGEDRLDAHAILHDLKADEGFLFSFRSAAEKFKLIDDSAQAPVVVAYGEEGVTLVDQLSRMGPERWLLRKLQRYVVNLPRSLHELLRLEGAIREVHPGVFIQGHAALYDDDLGFCADRSLTYEPDGLIV